MDVRPLLDELKHIARTGLYYAEDPYDEARYERLLGLVSEYYGEALDAPPEAVRERLRSNLGAVTPAVGATAVVVNDAGEVLVIRRPDAAAWSLPGGHANAGETPRETVVRETREETGLLVDTERIVEAYAIDEAAYDPHGAVTVVYRCVPVAGEPTTTHESEAVAWRDPETVSSWFADHRRYLTDALAAEG